MPTFWETLILLLALGWLGKRGVKYTRIWLAARRLNLRDRGLVEKFMEDGERMVWVHTYCNTRLRVGIDKKGAPHQYCWLCEKVMDGDTNPKGREGIPKPDASADESDNVIPFSKKSAA